MLASEHTVKAAVRVTAVNIDLEKHSLQHQFSQQCPNIPDVTA